MPKTRARRAVEILTSIGVLVGLLAGLALVFLVLSGAAVAANKLFGQAARPAVCLLFVVGASGWIWWRRHRERRAQRELRLWEQTAGWEPETGSWPWQELVRWPDSVKVLRAYRKRVEGLGVRTGELEFVDNALGKTVDRRDGRAAFAIVALAGPAPPMAVRLIRHPLKREPGEDEFLNRFELVGSESPRLGSPELRAAHLSGDVPPWTVIGDELFLFVPVDAPLRPRDLEDAVRRAIRVVRLLKLAVEVGEDR